MTYDLLRDVVTKIPDEFAIDELMEKLILLHSFEEGRRQYREGQYFTQEGIKQQLFKWLKWLK